VREQHRSLRAHTRH